MESMWQGMYIIRVAVLPAVDGLQMSSFLELTMLLAGIYADRSGPVGWGVFLAVIEHAS